MKRRRDLLTAGAFVALIGALGLGQSVLGKAAAAGPAAATAPRFEVDPMWPKPLPNGWYQGMTIGVSVDANDHVWIVHRPDTLNANEAAKDQTPPAGTCCSKAPPILEFDQQRNLLRH